MSTRLGRLASGWRVRGTRLVAVGLAAVCLSAAWAGGGRGVVQVVESRADQIVLEYQLGVFDQRVVDVNGQPYVQLALPHEAQLLTAGAPQLPHVARSVLLPDEGELAVAVTAAPFYEVENVDLAPSKGNLSRQINPEDVAYRFGLEYATDAFFPGALATLGEPYILRDCRGGGRGPLSVPVQPGPPHAAGVHGVDGDGDAGWPGRRESAAGGAFSAGFERGV